MRLLRSKKTYTSTVHLCLISHDVPPLEQTVGMIKKNDMTERVIATNVHPSNENIVLASGSGDILILRVNIFGYHSLGHVIFL